MSPDFWWGFLTGVLAVLFTCLALFVALAFIWVRTAADEENAQFIHDLNERGGIPL